MASTNNAELRGIIHGKTIELDREPGLPDGQAVTVQIQPAPSPGEGLRQAFGSWADISEEDLNQFLDEMRQSRKRERVERNP